MNEQYAAVLFVAVLLIALTALVIWQRNRTEQARIRRKIKDSYGKKPEPEYSQEVYDSIGDYARSRKASFEVDDITWHDLDMDAVFLQANHTVSSCGEDVLYDMMRHPAFEEKEIAERIRLSDYFDAHEEDRFRLQYLLSYIGRMRLMSVYDYIARIKEAGKVGAFRFGILAFIMLADIVFIFINPMIGVLGLVILLGLNVFIYLRMRDRTHLYISSFGCVLRLIDTSKKVAKLDIPEISAYRERLRESADSLASFRRGAFLVTSGARVSEGLGEIALEYLKMFFHIDLLKFDQMLSAYAGHEDACLQMIRDLGMIDACIAMASYRRMLKISCRPSFTEEKGNVKISVRGMVHPLLPEPVPNSFTMQGGNLVTGSNASGKSTFLKNVAISAILAQSTGIVPAEAYEAPFLRVMTSMALSDNLLKGESYFIVEIKSLKRILDAAGETTPLLCIIDEVLRGTNTIERIAASSQILKNLRRPHVLAFAATHDIELSYILEDLYENWHFEEEVGERDVIFNYELRKGRATTRNAIRLLAVMDYDPEIVAGARAAAENFEKTGAWKL